MTKSVFPSPYQLDVGASIPENITHAVSVSLPTFQSTVDYEEGKLKIKSGYPRFVLSSNIVKLSQMILDAQQTDTGVKSALKSAFLYPTMQSANRCLHFIQSRHELGDEDTVEISKYSDMCFAVVINCGEYSSYNALFYLAKSFWQHCGEGISSRLADYTLSLDDGNGRVASSPISIRESSLFMQQVKEILERLYFGADDTQNQVFLAPSGMSAIYSVHRALTQHRCRNSIQYGFPYLDTLKLQQKFNMKCHHIIANDNVNGLESLKSALLEDANVAFVITEVPSNPLLECPPLDKIYALCQQFNVPLIVDDTISGPVCLPLVLKNCDAVVSSLTKLVSGGCNVMSGGIILNSQSQHFTALKEFMLQYELEQNLWWQDLEVLGLQAQDYEQRALLCSKNAEAVANFLTNHPAVDKVFYPKFNSTDEYHQLSGVHRYYGPVLSVVLKQPEINTAKFYDALPAPYVYKGPSLGANFTLCCLYTLLAHYGELDTVEQFTDGKVSRYLIRFSIGCDEFSSPQQLIPILRQVLDSLL
ncbi:hypothetical protein MIR68_009384 [Amoeboaphelidium protococcarum]|nr:hypothetical protein MIR68_009384 [Amoeboaphelidium protococcarum]